MIKELTDKEFVMIRDYIKHHFGISLGNEKKSLIYSRLRNVLQDKGYSDFTQYFNAMINDRSGESVIQFIDRITTNHTFFMREADHFTYFRDVVLPCIEKTYDAAKDLRIWCAGCSSGEEPYTLQMIIQEYFKNKPGWNTDILATDISTGVLSKALMGIYANDSIKPLPPEWKKTYFKPYDAANSIVTDVLKRSVIIRKFNLMNERFPFKKPFQAIFCRNVMIYFDNETRAALTQKFYDLTEPGGYFFIGHSESLSQTKTDYQYIMPAIYRKVGADL